MFEEHVGDGMAHDIEPLREYVARRLESSIDAAWSCGNLVLDRRLDFGPEMQNHASVFILDVCYCCADITAGFISISPLLLSDSAPAVRTTREAPPAFQVLAQLADHPKRDFKTKPCHIAIEPGPYQHRFGLMCGNQAHFSASRTYSSRSLLSIVEAIIDRYLRCLEIFSMMLTAHLIVA